MKPCKMLPTAHGRGEGWRVGGWGWEEQRVAVGGGGQKGGGMG